MSVQQYDAFFNMWSGIFDHYGDIARGELSRSGEVSARVLSGMERSLGYMEDAQIGARLSALDQPYTLDAVPMDASGMPVLTEPGVQDVAEVLELLTTDALPSLEVGAVTVLEAPAAELMSVGSSIAVGSAAASEAAEISTLVAISPLIAAAVVAAVGIGYVVYQLTSRVEPGSGPSPAVDTALGLSNYSSVPSFGDRREVLPKTWNFPSMKNSCGSPTWR